MATAVWFAVDAAGSCDEEAARSLEGMRHYEDRDLDFRTNMTGECAATFETADPAPRVFAHYTRELKAKGWTVQGPGATTSRHGGAAGTSRP